MFICLRGFFKEGWGVGGSNCSKSGPRLLFSNSPLFYAPLPGETICKAFFHFKKRTQHRQTIFLSNRTECSQSRAIENWTRKYSSERHCLDLHTHCLCWWKKTHIFDAYMKPWEHLIKLTAVELKKKKNPTSILSLMFIRSQLRTLKNKGSAGLWSCRSPGCPCQAVGQCQKNRNKKWGSGRREDSRTHTEKCQRLLPKTSSSRPREWVLHSWSEDRLRS